MKSIILLLCLVSFAHCTSCAQWYRHKSEAKLAQMTPAECVDEWVKEQAHHRYDVLDEQGDLIRKYIMLDGTKALPRLVEYIDEYNPSQFRKDTTKQDVNFESCEMMIDWIDNFAVRLRASEEGRLAINALERSVERMRAAGYAEKKDGYDWFNGTFKIVADNLAADKGINIRDNDIKDTFRLIYKFELSDTELLELSNYLTAHYPDYPSWSERSGVKDYTRLNEAGNPLWFYVLKKPERYYEAYLEFKKTKQ